MSDRASETLAEALTESRQFYTTGYVPWNVKPYARHVLNSHIVKVKVLRLCTLLIHQIM
jgi:hypothetical protein